MEFGTNLGLGRVGVFNFKKSSATNVCAAFAVTPILSRTQKDQSADELIGPFGL